MAARRNRETQATRFNSGFRVAATASALTNCGRLFRKARAWRGVVESTADLIEASTLDENAVAALSR